jgi:hypothetical protein
MDTEKRIAPLDKEAPLLLPGLRYARSLIDIAMHVARSSAVEEALKRAPKQPAPPRN